MAEINTGKVARRTLRLARVEDLIAEVDRLVAAEHAGRLRRLGNWTPGQVFAHLAAWIEYGYDGYPLKPPPWIIRVILRWKLKSILQRGMPGGARIPGIKDGTIGQDPQPTEAAAERLKQAARRLLSEPARHDSPAFGPMSQQDRITLNLRHAELHLSFLTPD